ncbi:MAG: hypothetical protein Q9214_002853 [Letrouitia sp. 1 TL-2023]
MPIFTHISKGLLRENDDYSAQVVEKTMNSVVPRIFTSLQKRDEDPIISISKLMLNFVAAFEFIPPFRRMNVFSGLVRQLSADRFLYALVVLLIDKFPRNEQIVQFCSDLMEQHDIQTQLICFENLIKLILDLQMPKPTLSNYLVSTTKSKSTEYNSNILLVSFTTIMKDERFRTKMAKAPAHGEHLTEKVQALFSNLISQISLLSESKQQGSQFNSLCVKALNALFDVLPTSDLVQIFKYLLDSSDKKITRQALSSFESRLKSLRPTKKSIRQACLNVVPQLLSLVETSPDRLLQLTALHCIEHIAKFHDRNDAEAVEKVVEVISSNHCLKSEDTDFQVAAILCLSTLVEVLRDGFTSYLPLVLATVLEHFDNSIKGAARTARLHNACCSFFAVLLLHISWLMTGPHLDCILKACHGSAAAGMDTECNTERRRMMILAAKSTESQHLYASLSTTWSSAVCNGPEAFQEHLQLLNDVLGRQSKSAITLQSKSIWDLLLKAFDLRYTLSISSDRMGYDDSEVEELEESARSTAISMIYKLNDTTFRPLFIQGLEWTQASDVEDTGPNIYRQITWFYFLLEFFGNLKAVVTSYAGLIIEDATQVLNADPMRSVHSMLLWKRVILTLQQSFKHDQDEFWQSPSHFDPVCKSLTAQFQHASKVVMESEVIPAVTELAVAADSLNHHRSLNTGLLPLLRSDDAAVRLAAVHCELNLTSHLGEEWLGLLPEMLPLISELQEDDDEDVYAETLKWISRIEEILGESISPMLQ